MSAAFHTEDGAAARVVLSESMAIIMPGR